MAKVICLVGAGGKTTIMYELATKYAGLGKKVVVTTSTHIWEPKNCYARNIAEARTLWQAGCYAVAGQREASTGKLVCLIEDELKQYEAEADVVLLESDGAKSKPCKVPRAGEPVILPECDTVIGVVGMDALGCSIESTCFRVAEVCALLGVTAEHVLTEADLVSILLSEEGTRKAVGTRKYYVVLNKCDNAALFKKAAIIKELLISQRMKKEQIIIRGDLLLREDNISIESIYI